MGIMDRNVRRVRPNDVFLDWVWVVGFGLFKQN